MNPTFDLVIQGPIYPCVYEIINEYKKLSFVNKIIISSWESYSEYKLLLFDYNLKFVFNQDIDNPGRNNRNRKIKSCLNGIKASKSDYVIVMRSDILFDLSAFEKIYDFFLEHKNASLMTLANENYPLNKILCIHLVQDFPFHPNDWFFMGHKNDLETFFDIPYDTSNDLSAEIYFASHYISLFDLKAREMLNDYKNYLLDHSKNFEEAKSLSRQISSKILMPLPKNLVKIKWLKYSNDFHDWDLIEKTYDLLFHENHITVSKE
jgi:hypothetical protein